MSDEDPLVNGVPLSTLRVVDLKEELTRRGLAKHGNKSELAERLREHLLTGKILDSKSQPAGNVAAVTPTKEATPQPKISSPENPLIAAYKAKQQAALENQMKDASRIRAESGSASGDTPPISSPANSGSPIKSPAPEVKSPMKSAEPEPEKEKEKAKETEKKQPVVVAEVEQKKEKEQPPAKQEDREKTAKQQDKNGHGKDEKIEAGRQETEPKLKKEDTKAQEVKKEEKSEASQKNEQGNQSNDKQKQKEEKIEEKPKVEQKKQPVAEKSPKKEKTPPPKREKTPEEKQTRKEQNELEREQKREKQREETVSSRTATDSSGKDSDREDAEEELDYGDEQDEKEDKKNEERPGSASNSSATAAHRSRSAAAADSIQSKSAEPIEINGRKISPSRYPESEIVHIRGLVRPFTEGQLRSAISANDKRTIVDFWIDKVKSHCLAKMSSAEEAREVRLALHNSHWPESNPKTLTVQFDTQDNMERHKEGRPVAGQIEVGLRTSASATSPTPSAHRSSSTSEARIGVLPGRSSLKVTVEAALRENSKREVELVERRSRNSHKMEVDGDQEDDKSSRKRQHSPTPPHSRSMEIKRFNSDRLGYAQGHGQTENSLPKQKEGKSLDELFQRTKCQPFVYFKPLTDEEAAERDRQREARRKEREERRREMSGDRDKNRDRDRDRERHRDRERDNRDRAPPAASASRR